MSLLTSVKYQICERIGDAVEIGGHEYQVWSDPNVLGLDRYYVTRDGGEVESRLYRREAVDYLWSLQYPPGLIRLPSTSARTEGSGTGLR